jgi:hypothetical protein
MSALNCSRDLEDSAPLYSHAGAVAVLPPASGAAWTDAELGEIERLKAICSEHKDWELECDRSDSGDPWAVIYDSAQEWTVVHLARIDRRYVAVFPTLARLYRAATLRSAIDVVVTRVA